MVKNMIQKEHAPKAPTGKKEASKTEPNLEHGFQRFVSRLHVEDDPGRLSLFYSRVYNNPEERALMEREAANPLLIPRDSKTLNKLRKQEVREQAARDVEMTDMQTQLRTQQKENADLAADNARLRVALHSKEREVDQLIDKADMYKENVLQLREFALGM